LTTGGLILLPFALLLEPPLPTFTPINFVGLTWLGLIGAAATYWLWFRGLARLDPGAVSILGMMSPVTAVALGWLWLGQALTAVQIAGALIVLGSVWGGQVANRPRPAGIKPPGRSGQHPFRES
jgi:probable blue pigment (indigoidine) exporter